MNPLILLVAAVAAVVLLVSLSRPAPQQYAVTIEPVQPAGSGCTPLLVVLVIVLVLIILLTPS